MSIPLDKEKRKEYKLSYYPGQRENGLELECFMSDLISQYPEGQEFLTSLKKHPAHWGDGINVYEGCFSLILRPILIQDD